MLLFCNSQYIYKIFLPTDDCLYFAIMSTNGLNVVKIKDCLSKVCVLYTTAYGKYCAYRLSSFPRLLQPFQNAACMQGTLMMINLSRGL
jgi:hypothetical protein